MARCLGWFTAAFAGMCGQFVIINRAMRTECMPLNPVAIPINIMFLFPDGRPVLDLFDNEAAGFEGFVAMRGTDRNQDAGAANVQPTLEVFDIDIESVTPFLA